MMELVEEDKTKNGRCAESSATQPTLACCTEDLWSIVRYLEDCRSKNRYCFDWMLLTIMSPYNVRWIMRRPPSSSLSYVYKDEEDDMAAYAVLQIEKRRRVPPVVTILAIEVGYDCRRRGYGRAMVEAIERHYTREFFASGSRVVRFRLEPRQEALSFWKRLGYTAQTNDQVYLSKHVFYARS